MDLIELSDDDLLLLAYACDIDENDNHCEDSLCCQAWAVWESRDPIMRAVR